MRLLMMAQFYPPVVGGEERHVQDLSRELARRGHEVAVVTLGESDSMALDENVRVYRVRGLTQQAGWLYGQTERSHAPPVPDPAVTRALRRILAVERPDIVHAHNWMLYSFLPLKRREGPRFVLSLHDYSFHCTQKRLAACAVSCGIPDLGRRLACGRDHYGVLRGTGIAVAHELMRPAVRRAVDLFLPVSRAVAEGNGLLADDSPYEIVPNFVTDDLGLDEQEPPKIQPYLSQLPEDGFLLFVGDMSADKGIHVLLDAYRRLEDAPPLVVIGRLRSDTPLPLPPGVLALGPWPHRAVMAAWRRCAVGLVPSVGPEAFGIVAIEAMSAGRPVIASATGGLADIVVDGRSGLLVPPGDAGALAAALSGLLNDEARRRRLGEGARQRVRDFRASAVIPRFEAVYQSLLEGANHRPIARAGVSPWH